MAKSGVISVVGGTSDDVKAAAQSDPVQSKLSAMLKLALASIAAKAVGFINTSSRKVQVVTADQAGLNLISAQTGQFDVSITLNDAGHPVIVNMQAGVPTGNEGEPDVQPPIPAIFAQLTAAVVPTFTEQSLVDAIEDMARAQNQDALIQVNQNDSTFKVTISDSGTLAPKAVATNSTLATFVQSLAASAAKSFFE